MDHVQRFSPAILFVTEAFESFKPRVFIPIGMHLPMTLLKHLLKAITSMIFSVVVYSSYAQTM
jgi:hypothetical protein